MDGDGMEMGWRWDGDGMDGMDGMEFLIYPWEIQPEDISPI